MTASPLNYSVGKGILSWTPAGTTTEIDLGNCEKLSVTAKPNYLDHFSSRTGIKSKDRSVPNSLEAEVSAELDEITAQNAAMALFGTVSDQDVSDPGYDSGATTQLKKVTILGASEIRGKLKFVGTNAIGRRVQVELPNVIFKAGQAFDLISDEWMKVSLSGEVLFDATSGTFGEMFFLN